MNAYAIVILTALLAEYILSVVSDVLNVRHLQPELPDEFRDTFDEDEYEQAQAYTKTRTRFGLVSSTFGLVVLLVFSYYYIKVYDKMQGEF